MKEVNRLITIFNNMPPDEITIAEYAQLAKCFVALQDVLTMIIKNHTKDIKSTFLFKLGDD